MSYSAYLSSLEQKYGLPSGLLAAQMQAESGGNPSAVSPKGALGLFQFMPDTAKQYGIDPLDPSQAAEGAARLNADNLRKYGGDIPSALAAYNWGPGNLDKNGLQNAPEETQNYIMKVASALNPISSANAAEISNEDIDAELARRGVNSPSFSNDDIDTELRSRGINPDQPEDKRAKYYGEAQQSMGPEGSLYGVQRALQAYAANAAQGIPLVGTFTDEAMSAIGALAGMGEGGSFGDKYVDLQQRQQALREAGQANNPGATALGQVGTALSTIGLIPTPKTVPRSLVSAAGQGAKYGMGYGLSYGAGNADSYQKTSDAIGERIENAVKSGALGAGVGGALGAVGYAVSPKPTKLTGDDLAKRANGLYDLAEQKGGHLNEATVNKWVNGASEKLPQTSAGKVIAGKNNVSDLVDRIQQLKDKPLSLRAAQEVDEALGDMAWSNTDKFGRLNKQGKQILDIQRGLRNMIDNATSANVYGGKEGFEALKQARKVWSQSLKVKEIERIINMGDPAVTDNPATAIRSGFRALLKNPNRLRPYSAEERDLIRRAAKANLTLEALRGIGSRLVGIGATATGHPLVGVASQAVSGAARGLAGEIQASRGQDIISNIVNPAAKAGAAQKIASEVTVQSLLEKQRQEVPNITVRPRAGYYKDKW